MNMDAIDEVNRLNELAKYQGIIDQSEDTYNELARLATLFINTPYGGVSVVDDQYVWLKGRVGLDACRLNREGAFCSYAVESNNDLFIIHDVLTDTRFTNNPLVIHEPYIRSYAAATLKGHRGYILGTLWIMDSKPRVFSPQECNALIALAAQVVNLIELTYRHPISRLPTRNAFVNRLQIQLNRLFPNNNDTASTPNDAFKQDPQNGVVGYIHIHNLDLINSAYDRETGEHALIMFADNLRLWVKKNLLAHIDDNHFAFALLCSPENAVEKLAKLPEIVSTCITVNNIQVHLNCSIGISYFPSSGINASSLLDQAAAAATLTREFNVVTVKTYVEEQYGSLFQHMESQSHLPESIRDHHLVAHYQPQVDIQNGDVIGFEALARINDPKQGLIMPQEFIAQAEQSKLIHQVDLRILEIVCADLRHWLDLKLEIVPIAVNMSRFTILHEATVETIQRIVQQYDIPIRFIKLEITEGGLDHLVSASCDSLRHQVLILHDLGFKISIDDFGTGLSNLAALRLLKFEQLKADRLYVHGAASNVHIGGILRFIYNIAELFQVDLICEGLEDEADLEWVMILGCRYVQGWYFCKAVPSEATITILQRLPAFRSLKNYAPTALAEFLKSCSA
ncbi:MAG: sensor domain-containing phosphodiesterase [Gammaproteobacteria bacterium]|nr:sensor domain-containing phosphodiesterase [Gammaproteobacteria bacterium]